MSTSRTLAWIAWFMAALFYAYQYILRVMPNIMLGDILEKFDINLVIFGQFSGVYYIGYCLVHIPVGIALDHYGPKKVISACILLSAIGLLPIVYSSHWIYPMAGRALIGMGSSAAILGLFKIIRMTFDEAKFARMLSIAVTIGLLGAIYGGQPVSYMTETLGYETVVKLFALLGVMLAVGTYWIIPEMKKVQQETTILADLKEVLGNSKVIWTCIFAGFMVGPIEGFADVWATVFLKQTYGLDNATASRLPSMIFIGMCFGAPVLTYIAGKINNYLGTIIAAGILMAVIFFALISGELTSPVMAVSFVLVGVACAYQILAIYKASTYVKDHVVGLTTAMANMIIMSFGYAFHTFIGLMVNFMGGAESSKAFIYGIAIIPVMLSLGVIGFCILLYQERREKLRYSKIID